MAVVALDLGGTKLAAALLTRRGTLASKLVFALDGRSGEAVGELVVDATRALLKQARERHFHTCGVGVCVPGISYPQTGNVWAPNIPGWENYPLGRELSRAVREKHIKVAIDSDRSCYILGEAWRGAARGLRNAIYISVGTGIGAGILVDGQVLRGQTGIAGSIGWLALQRPFRSEYSPCGCFEYHASGEGLAKVASALQPRAVMSRRRQASLNKEFNARSVFAGYRRGDRTARRVIAEAIEFWGMAAANLVSVFNPQKLIFGGGVFGPGVQFLHRIELEARKWAQPIAMKQVRIEPSRLGGDAGLYGAGYLALRMVGQTK